MLKYFLKYLDEVGGEVFGYFVGFEKPEEIHGWVYEEVTKEVFQDYIWKNKTETYLEGTEISALFEFLHLVALDNITDPITLENWKEFKRNLFVFKHNDTIKYPYELSNTYSNATAAILNFTNDRQIEVFNDILLFGKHLEAGSGHSNILSKFYDLFAVGTYSLQDKWQPPVFDKSKYPSLNPTTA